MVLTPNMKTSCDSDSHIAKDNFMSNVDKEYLRKLGKKINCKNNHVAH
jgi:hypothetical protein